LDWFDYGPGESAGSGRSGETPVVSPTSDAVKRDDYLREKTRMMRMFAVRAGVEMTQLEVRKAMRDAGYEAHGPRIKKLLDELTRNGWLRHVRTSRAETWVRPERTARF
jgi:hypothetical protein